MTRTIPLSEARAGDFLVTPAGRKAVTGGEGLIHTVDAAFLREDLAALGITAERSEPVKVVVHAERYRRATNDHYPIRGYARQGGIQEWEKALNDLPDGTPVKITLEAL